MKFVQVFLLFFSVLNTALSFSQSSTSLFNEHLSMITDPTKTNGTYKQLDSIFKSSSPILTSKTFNTDTTLWELVGYVFDDHHGYMNRNQAFFNTLYFEKSDTALVLTGETLVNMLQNDTLPPLSLPKDVEELNDVSIPFSGWTFYTANNYLIIEARTDLLPMNYSARRKKWDEGYYYHASRRYFFKRSSW